MLKVFLYGFSKTLFLELDGKCDERQQKPPEVCACIHVLFSIYMCFLWTGQSQQSDLSAGPQSCKASSAVSLFYTCLRLWSVSKKHLQPTLGLVSKTMCLLSQSIRSADQFTGWKLMRSISRWHRWEWIDFVTCVSHTLPTQYTDYTLSSWQLHGALCETVVGNMLNKNYFFWWLQNVFYWTYFMCIFIVCDYLRWCSAADVWHLRQSDSEKLQHQQNTQRSSRALKTPGSF